MSLGAIAINLILPAPVLIVEDDMQVRLRLENLLLQFG
ncbi:hypothetical protein HNQ68_003464, partial [Pseudochrobactrum saccharolyticum]|nr:hypothetical protein [Pseudochrobactrum saccharolyticum]